MRLSLQLDKPERKSQAIAKSVVMYGGVDVA